jgi:MHS family proline/betaine transporter-like MFS transporter
MEMKASISKKEKDTIWFVTLGGVFEWYELFLYLYWIPILSAEFLDLAMPYAEAIHLVFIVVAGIIARPLGGVIFGYLGDTLGRKFTFIISIFSLIVPSCLIFLMDFKGWSYVALLVTGIIRFLQGIPAGGELPGALCLLYESAQKHNRKFICSFFFVGPQIGQVLSMLQSYLMQKFLTYQELVSWGWKVSFGIAIFLGFVSGMFRLFLKESTEYSHLKKDQKIEHHPFRESRQHHLKDILYAFLLSIFEVTSFFILYFYFFQHTKELFRLSSNLSIVVYLLFLTILTVSMPILGRLAQRRKYSHLFNTSVFGVIITSFILFYSIINWSATFSFIILIPLLLFMLIQYSFLPSFLAEMFPVEVRFTCLGLSFNVADGVIGGFLPLLASQLVNSSGNLSSFLLLLPITAILFIIVFNIYKKSKKTKKKIQ